MSPIHILCATNPTYLVPMTVMLTSVVRNYGGGRDLHLHIVGIRLAEDMREKVEGSIRKLKKGAYALEFHWSSLEKPLFSDRRGNPVHPQYLSNETYTKLLVGEILPATCERAIYLDCDLVVLKDISVLNDALDDKHILAATMAVDYPYVSSLHYKSRKPVVFNHAELGIAPSNPYFNAGVMVINLNLWRAENIFARIMGYLDRHIEEVHYHDQGGLNAILYDRWLPLDQRWNWILYDVDAWRPPAFSKDDWRRVRRDPWIVHFAGSEKPWKEGSKRPASSFFLRYLKKTPFRNEFKAMPFAQLESVVGRRIYFALWKLRNLIWRIRVAVWEMGAKLRPARN